MQEGRIENEAGSWNWQVTELRGRSGAHRGAGRRPESADPDPEPEPTWVLHLEDPEFPGDWMMCELQPTVDPDDVTEDEVIELARDPDRRQLTDPDGDVWILEPVPRPDAVETERGFDRAQPRVRVSRGGAPRRTLLLPEGRALGHLTRDELLELVRS